MVRVLRSSYLCSLLGSLITRIQTLTLFREAAKHIDFCAIISERMLEWGTQPTPWSTLQALLAMRIRQSWGLIWREPSRPVEEPATAGAKSLCWADVLGGGHVEAPFGLIAKIMNKTCFLPTPTPH